MKAGDKILVEVYNYVAKQSDWLPGTLNGFIAGDLHEDFERINVTLDAGTEIRGCHPDCIKLRSSIAACEAMSLSTKGGAV